MKKLIAFFLLLAMCLTACGTKEAAPITHSYEDLTISIPADFIDLSEEAYANGLTFIYGLDPIAVNGLREEKATFEAYGLELDLQTYGQLLLMSNNVGSALEQKDGIWTFTYEAGEFTYVVTLQETQDAFWTVQAYCPTGDYNTVKDQMWEILSSATV